MFSSWKPSTLWGWIGLLLFLLGIFLGKLTWFGRLLFVGGGLYLYLYVDNNQAASS